MHGQKSECLCTAAGRLKLGVYIRALFISGHSYTQPDIFEGKDSTFI